MDTRPILERLLSHVHLDEPFDWDGDLVTVLWHQDEPIGAFVGKTEVCETGPVARLEHVIILPGAGTGKRFLALADQWKADCVAKGLRQAVAAVPKDKARELILRSMRFWGFIQYHEDDKHTWWVRDLLAERRAV